LHPWVRNRGLFDERVLVIIKIHTPNSGEYEERERAHALAQAQKQCTFNV
jgi:hypothetical protein